MVTMLDWDFTNLFKTLFTGHFGHFQGPSFEKSRWPRMALQWRSGALNSGPAGDVPGEAVLPVMWISLRILYIHGYVSYGGRFTSTWVWINTYRYIFSGWVIHIHRSQLFWCEQKGYQGFWPIPMGSPVWLSTTWPTWVGCTAKKMDKKSFMNEKIMRILPPTLGYNSLR